MSLLSKFSRYMRTVTGNNTDSDSKEQSQEHPGQPAAGSPRNPGRSEKAPPSPPSLSLSSVGDGSERSSSYWCRNVNRRRPGVVYNEREVPEAEEQWEKALARNTVR